MRPIFWVSSRCLQRNAHPSPAHAQKKRKEKKEKSFGTPLFRDVPRDAIKYMFASFDIESSN